MFTGLFRKSFLAGIVVAMWTAGITAQINNDIFYKYCRANPQKVCFNPVEGAIDSVGRDVNELGGGFKFCMKIDTIDAGFAPIRVALVLDKSRSMCQNPSRNGCCVTGDSTGNCMNNDPTDMRVAAAIAFVDSLAVKSPNSEVGVVTYDQQANPNDPIPLNTAANISMIHGWIESAGCAALSSAPGGLGKTTAVKATYLGLGLQSGLTVVDRNFSEIPATMKRHIILLTDGAWDDVSTRSPQTLIDAYKAQYPERVVPTLHGVFLSNVELHRAHGYPDEGCSNTDAVVLTHLQAASTLGGEAGLYFPGSTPATVVSNFDALLKRMSVRVDKTLVGMIVTNTTNGVIRTQKTIEPTVGSNTDSVSYYATLDNLPLEPGLNRLKVQSLVKKSDADPLDTITAFVNILRTEKWSTEINQNEFEIFCVKDSTTINITVSPPEKPVNAPFDVHSTIVLEKEFVLDSVEVRVFTQFPNTETGTVGVFHLEKDLKNSSNTTEATGTDVEYVSVNALFGSYSLSKGSLGASITNLSADFALEAWIRIPAVVTPDSLFSGNGFKFGIGADRFLYFAADGIEPVKSFMPIDANSWAHVAVSRASGQITLFVNGMSASASVPFTAALIGKATINCPVGGMLDEIRVSSVSRQLAEAGRVRLDIPSLQKPVWTLAGASSTQPMLLLTPQMWKDGNIDFKFASPLYGKLVVNFQHKGTTETRWSKNGNPVLVAGDRDGPYVKNAIFITGPLGGLYDTLKVFFTEPVRCDSLKSNLEPSASFKIYGPGNVLKDTIFKGAYYDDRNACPATPITQITIITKASVDGIVPKRDSIQLIGSVVDTAGNGPNTEKRGPIAYGGNRDITIIPYESSKINPMELPEGIAGRIGAKQGTTGKVILIQTSRPLQLPNPEHPFTPKGDSTWALKTIIYDAVANVVAIDVPLKPFPNNDRLYYVLWPGVNRQNRRVAAAAYLFKATVMLDGDIEPRYLQTKFSVKWKNGE